MSFNLNQFVQYMDQVKDKDWLDEHLIIDGVDKETAKEIKDKIRDNLKELDQMKTPKENGQKYFAINLTDVEHKELHDTMNELCLITGIHKRDIIQILVKERLAKLKGK